MAKRSVDDQQATYAFGESLKAEADRIAALANALKILAVQAQDDQPVGGHLSGDMADVAASVGALAKRAESWYAAWRNGNRRDVERVEDPRKNPRAEAAADVGRAVRDV